jgi:hypothetical protein
MENTKYPDGSKEPDTEYNEYVNSNSKIKIDEDNFPTCNGDCENCAEYKANHPELANETSQDFDEAILNSSALTKNADKKDNKYEYTNNQPLNPNRVKEILSENNTSSTITIPEEKPGLMQKIWMWIYD